MNENPLTGMAVWAVMTMPVARRPGHRLERTTDGPIVNVQLDPRSVTPLYHQLYAGIRQRILNGSLAGGAILPSSRSLARDLSLSRSTVMLAYEQLRIEGFIEARSGSSTRVSATLPGRVEASRPVVPSGHGGTPARRGRAMVALPRPPASILGQVPRAFRAGMPAVDIFPVDIWGRILARRWRRVPASALAYQEPFGYPPLREAVAGYLRAARGVRCTPSQVMIVNGAQQGFDLIARTLLDPGDDAWVEEPGYLGTRAAVIAAGGRCVTVPVDQDGLVVDAGAQRAPAARLAFVTASRHVPLGVTMSLPRRMALLDWAGRNTSWIVEDDYDSEFRYSGRPLAALQGLDDRGCVLYVGTFSKVTFPAMRLGYVVVPETLIDVFQAVRLFMDFSSPVLEQMVMADFIADGHFERHIRRMRTLYQERQRLLVGCAAASLGGLLEMTPSDAGMTLVGWLPDGVRDEDATAAAQSHGVDVLPLSRFASQPVRAGLLLGYAGVREWEIREGVDRLRLALMGRRTG